MVSFENVFAALVLAACLVMLARLALGPRRRQRFDASARRLAAAVRHAAWRIWHWRDARRKAARAAEDAIRRAHGGQGVGKEGNVYRPKSFRRPRKPH